MFLVILMLGFSSSESYDSSQMCLKTSGEEDWCSWSAYKCCEGFGCCGPERQCCWRSGYENVVSDGCCASSEQCCSTDVSSVCCPLESRCCKDSRGMLTCCTKSSSIDKILFAFTGVLLAVLVLLVLYHYFIDKHDPKVDICKCSKCKIRRRVVKERFAGEIDANTPDSLNMQEHNGGHQSETADQRSKSDITVPMSDFTPTTTQHEKLRLSSVHSRLDYTEETPTEDIVMLPDHRHNKYFPG
ncbi:hypothetical protein ACHWQZ_G001895 [Mnemiopsis leidyi]